MKLVEFENGKFGVRLYWIYDWYFRDLTSHKFSWRRQDHYFKDCQGSREEAEEYMNKKPEKYMKYLVVPKKLTKSMKNPTGGEYKTITFGPGTKLIFKNHHWEEGETPFIKKDENGFEYTHMLQKGTIIIKYEDAKEEEHQKENVVENPTGKRMIQL